MKDILNNAFFLLNMTFNHKNDIHDKLHDSFVFVVPKHRGTDLSDNFLRAV